MKSFVVLILICALVIGCTTLEKVAYRTVVASKAFLDSVKAKHPECGPPNRANICVALRKATAGKDALVDAGEVYCGVATFGNDNTTPCHPVKSAEATLQNALANYQRAEKDLKAVIR